MGALLPYDGQGLGVVNGDVGAGIHEFPRAGLRRGLADVVRLLLRRAALEVSLLAQVDKKTHHREARLRDVCVKDRSYTRHEAVA
ncbi:hypothetical protein ACGFSG_35860 [Streptomyces sp. NPDC048512]|uniref:hypothetical protein n=1 Tax=unclassified Streptomyces TaxID=2593676 RepID=UPI0009BF1137|nr:hypothetical protein [Streptomyces sp. M41(2017)]OQQ19914.1 hypothetical protein B0675_24745 [Streptomyces sp. M41(2017)]